MREVDGRVARQAGAFVRGVHTARRIGGRAGGKGKSARRWRGSLVYDTSGGVAREGWGYALGKQRWQDSDQVSEERALVGLTCAPPNCRDSRPAAAAPLCCILSRYACYGRPVGCRLPLLASLSPFTTTASTTITTTAAATAVVSRGCLPSRWCNPVAVPLSRTRSHGHLPLLCARKRRRRLSYVYREEEKSILVYSARICCYPFETAYLSPQLILCTAFSTIVTGSSL